MPLAFRLNRKSRQLAVDSPQSPDSSFKLLSARYEGGYSAGSPRKPEKLYFQESPKKEESPLKSEHFIHRESRFERDSGFEEDGGDLGGDLKTSVNLNQASPGKPQRNGSKRIVSTLQLQTETMQIDGSDSDSFTSSDEDDSYTKKLSRLRARHAARLDVYRQQIQTVTSLTVPPVLAVEDTSFELKDDQHELIPLQVLRAHQFPREGRRRNLQLTSFASHPNLRRGPLPPTTQPYFGQSVTARSVSAGNLLSSIQEIGGATTISRIEKGHDEIASLKNRMKRETRHNLVQAAGKRSLIQQSKEQSHNPHPQYRSRMPGRYRPLSVYSGFRQEMMEEEEEEEEWRERRVRRLNRDTLSRDSLFV